MWDKPDLLNNIASLLFAAALLIVAYGVLHFVVRLPAFPLREIHISGELAHVTFEEIEGIVQRELKGNFFTLDLNAARSGFETLPWVRKANARRQWPDRLEVELEEHIPLARWGAAALVNTYGEVFAAPSDGAPANREQGSRLRDATGRESAAALSSTGVASVSGVTSPKGARRREEEGPLRGSDPADAHRAGVDAPMAGSTVASPRVGPLLRVAPAPVPPSDGALPLFLGPQTSAKEIAIQYRYFQRSLAAIGQVPVQVQVSPRRAWQIRLDSGLVIELGRERIESRLDRFIALYEGTVGRLQRKLDYVDLRYPNGFAVRIPELKPGPRDQHRRAGSNTKRG